MTTSVRSTTATDDVGSLLAVFDHSLLFSYLHVKDLDEVITFRYAEFKVFTML